jgi:hypothetical protein
MLARFRQTKAKYYKGGGENRGGVAPEPKDGYDLPIPQEEFPNDEAADAAALDTRAQDAKVAGIMNQSGGNEPVANDEVEVHQFSNATPQGNDAMANLQRVKLQQDHNKSLDVPNVPEQDGGFKKRKRWPPQRKKTKKRQRKKRKRKRKTKKGGDPHPKYKKNTRKLQSHDVYNPINPVMSKKGGKRKTRKYKQRRRKRKTKKHC